VANLNSRGIDLDTHKKICNTCAVEKLGTEFSKASNNKDGLVCKCRPCVKEWDRKHREANLEEIKAYDRARYIRDREKRLALSKHCNSKRKPIKKIQDAVRYNLNREAALLRAAVYKRENRGRYNALGRARELKKIQATPSWSEREEIISLYNEATRLTVETGIPHHVDHIIPITHSLVQGLHVLANLRILTAKKNIERGNRIDLDKYDHFLPNELQP
jgi:hypothetical protein